MALTRFRSSTQLTERRLPIGYKDLSLMIEIASAAILQGPLLEEDKKLS